MMRKFLSILLALSMICCAALADESVATGVGAGRNADITVAVTLDGGTIVNVEVTEHAESEGIADGALELIPQWIVDQQSIAVDSVSGATITSDGIKLAVADALTNAGLNPDDYAEVAEDCETLAGMLLSIKGDFPKEKEPLVYGRCHFLVMDVADHRITEVRVKIMPETHHEQ